MWGGRARLWQPVCEASLSARYLLALEWLVETDNLDGQPTQMAVALSTSSCSDFGHSFASLQFSHKKGHYPLDFEGGHPDHPHHGFPFISGEGYPGTPAILWNRKSRTPPSLPSLSAFSGGGDNGPFCERIGVMQTSAQNPNMRWCSGQLQSG